MEQPHPSSEQFAAAVREEVQRRLGELQLRWAADMEQMMREQVALLDQAAEDWRGGQEAQREEMARQERARWAQEKDQLLKAIALRLSRSGNGREAIADWLGVGLHQVAAWTVAPPWEGHAMDAGPWPDGLRDARLRYEQEGRGGWIWLESASIRFAMWWEYAGRDALVLIDLPATEDWEKATGLPLAERDMVIRFIASRTLQDRVGGRGRWTSDGRTITLFA